jgi:hypothetical protein
MRNHLKASKNKPPPMMTVMSRSVMRMSNAVPVVVALACFAGRSNVA